MVKYHFTWKMFYKHRYILIYSILLKIDFMKQQNVSQPHFWKSVRMTLTLPKWGLGSPPGLSKLQSSIARVKTPRLEMFFMSWESY